MASSVPVRGTPARVLRASGSLLTAARHKGRKVKQDPNDQGKEGKEAQPDRRGGGGGTSSKPGTKASGTSRKTASAKTTSRKTTSRKATSSGAVADKAPPAARKPAGADTPGPEAAQPATPAERPAHEVRQATTQRLHHPVAPGTILMAIVDALRPTQITVGAFHVAQKIHVTRRLSERKRAAFLEEHPVHVIIGPAETMYVVDHHHWVKAWHDLGIEQVPVIVRKDLSRLSGPEFWRYMVKHHQVHPYDEHGRRRPLAELPRGVQGMRDDPYRSLEAFAQRAGAYRKVKTAYPDFRWADFFRKEIDGPFDTPHGFAVALAKAVRLAHSDAARDLPGYMGKTKFCE